MISVRSEWSARRPADGYPTTLDGVADWVVGIGLPESEALHRFAQYGVLRTVALDNFLRDHLILRGAGVLTLFHGHRRHTADLDFVSTLIHPDTLKSTRLMLHGKLGLGLEATFKSLMPDYAGWRDSLRRLVKIQICDSAGVCETRVARIDMFAPPIRVCTLEDVLADKLFALAGQSLRNRRRGQDLLDVATMLKKHGEILDRRKLAWYFRIKCSRLPTLVCGSLAFDGECRKQAQVHYHEYAERCNGVAPSFDAAWSVVLDFVTEMPVTSATPFSNRLVSDKCLSVV